MGRKDIVKNRKSMIFIFVIQVVFGLGLCIACILVNFTLTAPNLPDLPYLFQSVIYPNDLEEPDPQILRTIVKSDVGLELLWSHSGVRITKRSGAFVVAAAKGTLFYIGLKAQSASQQEVVALDSNDGESVFWRTDSPGLTGPNVIYATSSTLYVGGSGVGKVAAYELRTGEILWSKSYPFQRTVTDLQVVDDLVYMKAVSSFRALLQADTGQEIEDWNSVPNFTPKYFENKTLTADIEFDNGPGTISAKDRQTGRILWETNALSNAVVTKAAVYLITEGDNELKLLGVEPRSGEIINSVTFEPRASPDYLKLYDFPHRLALDKELGILYVFLRDSKQLFAFKIVGYPSN